MMGFSTALPSDTCWYSIVLTSTRSSTPHGWPSTSGWSKERWPNARKAAAALADQAAYRLAVARLDLIVRIISDGDGQLSMGQAFSAGLAWLRVHFFRFWTALAVLAASAYLWLNKPEYLTWWKRSIERLIEDGSAELPYPWGDRLESTIGNFGIWVQLTVAILIFRAILGIVLLMIRTVRKRKRFR